ncbi:MAG: hypothetical protein HYZ37_07530 [Candidatus Solibacter usitatus]|nr:hypothetical protein [Candidatus Solibacter usitatus]
MLLFERACFVWMLANSPARTVQIQIDQWTNRSVGFHNIDRQRANFRVALSDSSSRIDFESEAFRYYLFPIGHQRMTVIRSSNEVYVIDHDSRTFYEGRRGYTWAVPGLQANDSDCSRKLEQVVYNVRRIGELAKPGTSRRAVPRGHSGFRGLQDKPRACSGV